MLITVVTWLFITYLIFCYGMAFCLLWNKLSSNRQRCSNSLDEIVIMGICIITVLAQYISLFYKIGLIANILLLIGSIIIILFCHKDIWNYFSGIEYTKKKIWLLCFACVTFAIMLMIGVLPDTHYDTALYHAQAIRWIEKYGVVKGLGNLHHRLAYNSSFLVLQALFGYKSVFGIELHSMNAYIAWILLVWSVGSLSIWKKDKMQLFDVGKLLYMLYLYLQVDRLSSPNTDFLAISLTLYILSKWLEAKEENKKIETYLFLCFLAVFALTLKLSVGACLLLAIYPLYLLCKNKQWTLMGRALMVGILIGLPFLLRNIMISGYLLYPVSSLGISGLDWKMALEEVLKDKEEITLWARGELCIASGNYKDPLKVWIPMWYQSLEIMWKCCVWVFVGSIPLASIYYLVINKEELKRNAEVFAANFGLLLIWFLSAPGIRFGGIFLMVLPLMLLVSLGIWLKKKVQSVKGYTILMSLFLVGMISGILKYAVGNEKYVIYPAKYTENLTEETELDGVLFYAPVHGDQTGYEDFPQLTYPWRKELIELREYGNLREGFRMKGNDKS